MSGYSGESSIHNPFCYTPFFSFILDSFISVFVHKQCRPLHMHTLHVLSYTLCSSNRLSIFRINIEHTDFLAVRFGFAIIVLVRVSVLVGTIVAYTILVS